MPIKPLPREEILTMLVEAPGRINELTQGLEPAQFHSSPEPDGWSINEVLAHLRSCSDMWGQAIETIGTQDRPVFKAINPRTWIKQTDYLVQDFQTSFPAYRAQRSALLAYLESLGLEAWLRSATVKVAGKPLERTIYYYAQWLATHERSHIKQISGITRALKEE